MKNINFSNKSPAAIRLATPDDLDILLGLIHELAVYEDLTDILIANRDLLYHEMFECERVSCFLAEIDQKAVGYAMFYSNFSSFLGRSGIFIEDIFVQPEHRGKGIGKAFFSKIAAVAVQRGCMRIEWCCLDWNKPSIDFYLSLGAEQLNEWTTYRLTGDRIIKLAEPEN